MTDLIYPKTNQEIIEYFVCGDCGGKLSLIDIKDEGERAWCSECKKTHTGVMPEVYEIAVEYDLRYYGPNVINDDRDRKRANTGKMCEIICWVKKRMEESGWQHNGPSLPKTKMLYCYRCGIRTAHSPGGCLTCELDDYDKSGGAE